MDPEQITIERPTLREYARVKEVVALSFKDVAARPKALARMHEERWYEPQDLFVAKVGGELVSSLGIRKGVLWIQGVAFSAGMLGTVCAHPDWRGRGIGSVLMRHAIRHMTDSGLAISYLHTIPPRFGFYERLGYVRAEMPRTAIELDSRAVASSMRKAASGSRGPMAWWKPTRTRSRRGSPALLSQPWAVR